MNILPKKSWHVRNKDNIAKVRRDEAQAAAEEEERQNKISLAEQEARTSLLRSRVKKPLTRDNDEVYEEVKRIVPHKAPEQSGHINLFTDFEAGKRKNEGVNPEHEEEKKQEKEEFEKKIGLLTYLGQSAIDAQKSTPWYAKAPERKKDDDDKAEKDKKGKSFNDPIHDMLAQIRVVRKKEGRDGEGSSSKKQKRDKDIKAIIASSTSKKPAKTIEQLRAERIKRESEERGKVLQLMAKAKGEKEPPKPEENPDDRSRKYNSQFNPHLSRR